MLVTSKTKTTPGTVVAAVSYSNHLHQRQYQLRRLVSRAQDVRRLVLQARASVETAHCPLPIMQMLHNTQPQCRKTLLKNYIMDSARQKYTDVW